MSDRDTQLKNSEIIIRLIIKPKMINLKLRDEIQNIYLFIDVYLYLFVLTVSFNEV